MRLVCIDKWNDELWHFIAFNDSKTYWQYPEHLPETTTSYCWASNQYRRWVTVESARADYGVFVFG